VITFHAQRRPVLKVWVTGDWHVGHRQHYSSLLGDHLKFAEKEKWLMLHAGDSLELVTPTSSVARRGALIDQSIPVEEQRQYLQGVLKRINAGVYLVGNHEQRIDAATGLDFVAMLASANPRIVPLTVPDIVCVIVGNQSYFIYLHHGEGPSVNPLTLHDRLQRDVHGVDVIVGGHIHRSTVDTVLVQTPEGVSEVLRFRAGHYLGGDTWIAPQYYLRRPVGPSGTPGSWLLTLHGKAHKIDFAWLGPSLRHTAPGEGESGHGGTAQETRGGQANIRL
jgi:predicted phosphodiesterase